MAEPLVTLLVGDIRLPLTAATEDALALARRMAGLPARGVLRAGVHRLSVDARRGKPVLVYTVALQVPPAAADAAAGRKGVRVYRRPALELGRGSVPLTAPPVVCGMGPAGLFAAYLLAREGYRPLVLEQGPPVQQRLAAVRAYARGGPLQPRANIQFGEGGAGAFSDGKLVTRIHDPLCAFVTDTLLAHGAPPDIAFAQRPHIGTDLLRGVIAAMRGHIIAMGGRVLFNTALTGLQTAGGRLQGVHTQAGDIPCQALVLAPGHSARDTFAMLRALGLPLEAKPFSVGLRIEHLQADIERALYHDAAGHPALPRGEYQLSAQVDGRGVYTFCMCPGGQVVAAASEPQTVVTNGMSLHARSGPNANAAVVVSLAAQDFAGDPWRAVTFQRELERAAFVLGGGRGCAPAQDVASFLQGKRGLRLSQVRPTYPRGVCAAELGGLLGAPLARALRGGLERFAAMLPGYTAAGAVLTGVESRTSSPLRLLREGHTLQCTALAGLYPAGEGAGYAGGIMSAAVDGLRAARAIIAQNAPPP